jgi:acetylornithine deacetylase/succinyl-diaminopimelate desuccinylase-like protein
MSVGARVVELDIGGVFRHIEEHRDQGLEELADFCRIPSVSAKGQSLDEAANHVVGLLEAVGARVRKLPTEGGPPVVFGDLQARGAGGTLLLYNHYDVQPVEPLELWKSDPFKPEIRDDRFYARGSGDTKGNLVAQLMAVRAFQETAGGVPINLKFLVEGEEEIGSPHFSRWVERNRDLLGADGATFEGGQHTEEGRPQIEFGSKGLLYVELRVKTADVDQHSLYAPIVPNAAWRLIQVLNALRDPRGRIKIPDFYEGIRKPTALELRYLRRASLKADDLRRSFGARELYGGPSDYGVLKKEIYSPTCNICGIWAGYTGPGSKTVNPSEAGVKIDFRLLPGQRPEAVLEKLRAHLIASGFGDVGVQKLGAMEPASTPLDSRLAHVLVEAAPLVYGQPPDVLPWSPGSMPTATFTDFLGIPVASGPGVGYDGSGYHAPNEHIRLGDFVKGGQYFAALMARF